MIKKWFAVISDHRISLRERMFRIVTAICMIAIVFTMPMGRSVWNILMLAVSLIAMAVITKISIRTKRIHTGATLVAVLLLILFPLTFFSAGGFYSGVPEWFVLCFIYVCITLQGRRRIAFFGLCTAETMLCYSLAFYFPALAAPNSQHTALFDSAFSMIMVGLLTSVLLMFLNRMYEEENALSQRQKKEIEELNKAENHFFSSMSHEIRTPINTIIGLNEIILRESTSEEVAENARNIQGASRLLLSLINDILDISKIKSGKMEIVNVSYETGSLFSEIVNMIWIKAREKGLEFKLHVDPSIPSMLCGDEVRIKQILINLLNNAIKYTSEGSVTLSVRCERLSLNRVRVWYSVEDTGLGLSIVQQLVELMGGEISVNSVYTRGSTFIVRLDQDILDDSELGTFTLASRSKVRDSEPYRQSFEAPDAHILVVDDNEMNLMVVKKLLAETKIQIDTASSGAECLRLTLAHHYDCILMDHLMPEMDGIACLHALRVQPAGLCQSVPVVALTANAGSDNQLLYRKEGFSGYLAKPVSGALLEAAVLSILPKGLVHLNEEAHQSEVEKDILIFEQTQRRSILVTTDSVCDLPDSLVREFGISVCPYYVDTDDGRFLDGLEIQPDELLMHIAGGRKGISQPPRAEDYERFFAEKLTEAQNVIHISHMMCQSGRISKRIQILCDALLLHPVLMLRKSRMGVGYMEMGSFSHVAKKYVKKTLQDTRNIDRRILFITYSGMDEKKLQYIQSLVQQYCPFERVYLQKASSAIASNCGPESFGLLFMRRDDNVISFFETSSLDAVSGSAPPKS